MGAAEQRQPIGLALVSFLQTCPAATLTLRFEELEARIGQPLPASARKYSHWWHGPQHRHVRRWQELGWQVSCSLAAEMVTFTRASDVPGST